MKNRRSQATPPSEPPPRTHTESQKARNVAELLTERFDALRSQPGVDLDRTAAAEAQYLGISASYLSRIRNGKAALTEELAQKIARTFEPSDEGARKALLRELEVAREASPDKARSPLEPDITPNAIIDFFDRVAQPGSLLCVDYRDLPQATSSGPFPQTAVEAAYAVAHGLSFAMFQPFGPVEALRERLVDALESSGQAGMFPCIRLYEYLFKLAARVRQVYEEMQAEVQKHEDPLGRLVLYEAERVPETILGCGIQSRLFYVDYAHALRHYSEVYQWIASDDRHYFIRRGGESLSPEAVREQFHPITTYWNEERRSPGRRLPRTNAELAELEDRFGNQAGAPRPKWRVWESTKGRGR